MPPGVLLVVKTGCCKDSFVFVSVCDRAVLIAPRESRSLVLPANNCRFQKPKKQCFPLLLRISNFLAYNETTETMRIEPNCKASARRFPDQTTEARTPRMYILRNPYLNCRPTREFHQQWSYSTINIIHEMKGHSICNNHFGINCYTLY